MRLNLIYGGVGTGKTEHCIRIISNIIKNNPNERAILIVPEQYSYTTERSLIEKLGGTGANGIEVLTFSQLFRRYIKKVKNYLSPSGKNILFSVAVSEVKEELGIFSRSADKTGFVDKIAELVSEMKRSLIEPEDLTSAIEHNDGILAEKLKSFKNIYTSYNDLIKCNFADSDDDFKRLAEAVMLNDEFKNTHIFFDGFSDFLPQHYEVIKAFLKSAKSLNITLCLPEGEKTTGDIFTMPAITAQKLKKLCNVTGANLSEQYCGNYCYRIKSDEIRWLLENWDKRRNVYKKEVNDISLFCARDLYSETEEVAKKIIETVKSGVRFGDIGVLCGNSEQYEHLIDAVFSDFKIPYFNDSAKKITEHPIILTVLAAFDIAAEGWSYEAVFKYLRAGYIYIKEDDKIEPIDIEDIDILENYVLKHGVRGKKKWLCEDDWQENSSGVFSEFIEGEKETAEDMERINSVRRKIIKPFEKFYNTSCGCVRECAIALFEFLCDIHIYEGIEIETETLLRGGMNDEAERMKKIWNLLMEVINQAASVAGEKKCSREKFCEMMRAGLSKAEMQIIPPGVDSVAVGAADKNSPAVRKILFFIGAVNGTMPAETHAEGILNDADRNALIDMGFEIGGNPNTLSARENFKFYRSVMSATEKLYFSYPAVDSEGNSKYPAAFVGDLHKMFPKMKIYDGFEENFKENIFTPRQAFLHVMRSVKEENCRTNVEKIKECFKDSLEFSEKLDMIDYAEKYRKVQPQITAENAKLLYNNYHRYSVSKLNDYSACPFRFFVKHGLKAKEQEIQKIHKFEIGSLLHWAVCEYCREVEKGNENQEECAKIWSELSKEESNEIIDKIMSDISLRILKNFSHNRGRIEYLLKRMKKILIRSVEIVRLSLANGEYTTVCYEQKFEIEIKWNEKSVGLNGVIDRVDAAECKEEGKIYLRVIDYKSGSKSFDVISVANSSDMQLVVYAIAATELYKKGALGRTSEKLEPVVGGILYNKLRDDMLVCSKKSPEDADAQLISKMKLDGSVVTGDDEISDAERMDRKLASPGSKSEFLKLAVNAKGNGLDKRLSAVMPRNKFEILMNYVKKTTVNLDDEIFKGNIGINPSFDGNVRACRYCKFKEICLYDIRTDGEKKLIEKEDDAWQHMESEIKK